MRSFAATSFIHHGKRYIGLSRLFVFSLIISLGLFVPATANQENADKIPKTTTVTATTDARFSLPSGFTAISESRMNWADAIVFCQQQGGRLPRINNSDSWDGWGAVHIDGFGTRGDPWPGLPEAGYWVRTAYTGSQYSSWVVDVLGGIIVVYNGDQRYGYRVICVP